MPLAATKSRHFGRDFMKPGATRANRQNRALTGEAWRCLTDADGLAPATAPACRTAQNKSARLAASALLTRLIYASNYSERRLAQPLPPVEPNRSRQEPSPRTRGPV